jgi:hypothetical protein
VSCPRDVGDPSRYPVLGNANVAGPSRCAANRRHEGYLHVAGPGSRPFSIAAPGKATGCLRPGDACTSVDLGAFLQGVTGQFKARGIEPVSWGIGACGRGGRSQSWDDQHFSIVIGNWRDANEAVAIISEQLRAWDVGQSFEVAVQAAPCVQAQLQPAMSGAGARWTCDRGGACTLGAEPDPQQCGDVRCSDPQHCCNPSCSTCVGRGEACFMDDCLLGTLR